MECRWRRNDEDRERRAVLVVSVTYFPKLVLGINCKAIM